MSHHLKISVPILNNIKVSILVMGLSMDIP